ncbi:MAG: hypothetical protein CMM67_10120 [Rhodospirillaceae bacterium]|nr:hypothetical protein [Rhodospirillaceae bacterium]OUT76654.1 MAG: hypothetical protein CBB83_10300 [Rhodospirillaceae bacterium TMED23]|tara:strand:- start:50806 stop:52272 length:1467 start_codon:yes stop_codon:yes gene_type:complete
MQFDNTYSNLPEHFFERTRPVPVTKPTLICCNNDLFETLNLKLNLNDSEKVAEIFSGNIVLDGSDPIALAYAGHQFGHFVPQLGDGRAVLLGEVLDSNKLRWDVQLKGSGPTPFSRNGDGRAALGPVIREYILSESMNALGVSTTRSLVAVLTGESVIRETSEPGAILTRIASCHVRVGTFQYYLAKNDINSIKLLADYAINRLYPDLRKTKNPYLELLKQICHRQACLIASWMNVGFIHGVMNTDNMAISGETIDYGPCAFLDNYNSDAVFSSIDSAGRYSFGNQAKIAQWNLARLAECFLPLLDPDEKKAIALAMDVIEAFYKIYNDSYLGVMRQKFGFLSNNLKDKSIIDEFLDLMQRYGVDYTLTMRKLCGVVTELSDITEISTMFSKSIEFDDWIRRWRNRLRLETVNSNEITQAMMNVNPIFIPRNHLIEKVIQSAVNDHEFQLFHDLLSVLVNPYKDNENFQSFKSPPKANEIVNQTYCGT